MRLNNNQMANKTIKIIFKDKKYQEHFQTKQIVL